MYILENWTSIPAELCQGCYDCLVKGDCHQNWLEHTEHFPHCRTDSHLLTNNKVIIETFATDILEEGNEFVPISQ